MLQFLAIPVVLGLAGLLAGCSGSSAPDAGTGSDSPAGSGSSFVPAPAGSASAMPAARPNPIFAPRTDAMDIGAPPTDRTRGESLQAWVHERAVQPYIDHFNTIARTTVDGRTVENLYGDNYRAAITEIVGMIARQTSGGNQLRVSYNINGTAVVPVIDNPLALFLDRLIVLRPETRTAVEALRREVSAGAGGTPNPNAGNPRPVASGGGDHPRPSGGGGNPGPRATARPRDPAVPRGYIDN